MHVFVLGSAEVVAAFSLGGMRGRQIAGRGAALEALDHIRSGQGVQVLVVEEGLAASVREELDKWKLDPRAPLIVEVPGFAGPSEKRQTAQDLVHRALGIQI